MTSTDYVRTLEIERAWYKTMYEAMCTAVGVEPHEVPDFTPPEPKMTYCRHLIPHSYSCEICDAPECGATASGGPCVLPRGHNMGKADIPSNHSSRYTV